MEDEGKEQEEKEEKQVEYPYEFDEDRRELAKIYSKQKLLTGLVQGTFLIILVLCIFSFTPLSRYLQSFSFSLIDGTFLDLYWLGVTIYIILFSTIIYLSGLPLSYYSGFLIEHKYDLSNQTLPQWLKDQVKSLLISLVMATPLILAIFYLGTTYPDMWWLYAGIIYFIVLGVLSNISHLIIIPLFYDTEELKDKELKQRLISIAEDNGVSEVKKVMVVKAGEKTEKANAGFAGMGKTKRILLFDTLLNKFHKSEIESVVAHEMGHYVQKDTLRFILIEGLLIFPMFYLTGYIFNMWAGFSNIYNLPFFLLIMYGLYSIVDPMILAYNRYREKKADSFALDVIGNSTPVISTFKRLSDIDLAQMNPHPLVEIFFYSHPPPDKRIDQAKETYPE
ncbi:MAG: M48 family metallopeptidase [Thermoplasmatota archaeon]